MENKVSDNVIEKKIIGSALNSMKSTKVGPAILICLQQRLPLKICMSFYKNGILTGRFTQDKDYVVRCADLVTLAEENKDSLFYDAWRIWFRYFVSMGYAGWNELWEAV